MILRILVTSIALLFILVLFIHYPMREAKGMDQPLYQLPASANDIHPLLIGTAVPRLTLTTAYGGLFDLNAAISKKPTVVIFYRGGW